MGKFPIALYTFFCNTQQQGAKRANKDSIISPGVGGINTGAPSVSSDVQ